MLRSKDIRAGSLVVKVRGKKKYVYLVYRVGRKIVSVMLGLITMSLFCASSLSIINCVFSA